MMYFNENSKCFHVCARDTGVTNGQKKVLVPVDIAQTWLYLPKCSFLFIGIRGHIRFHFILYPLVLNIKYLHHTLQVLIARFFCTAFLSQSAYFLQSTATFQKYHHFEHCSINVHPSKLPPPSLSRLMVINLKAIIWFVRDQLRTCNK